MATRSLSCSLRAGVTALVVALPAAAAAQPHSIGEYRAIVSGYRDGGVVPPSRLSAHDAAAIEPLVQSAIEARWGPLDLQAAAMLHTDVGISLLRAGRIEEAAAHVNFAVRLIDATIETPGRNDAYAARWYAAVTEIVRVSSPAWGKALDQRRSDRFASRTALAAMARGRTLELLAKTGVRGRSDTPTVRWNPMPEFEEAVHVDPELHEAWLHLGRLRMTDRDASGAMDALRRATASPERRVRYLAAMFIGAIHEREERFADAEQAYRRAVDTYPWAQSARLALTHLLSRTAREAEAREMLARQFQTPTGGVADPLWTYYAAPDELLDATLRELRIEVLR